MDLFMEDNRAVFHRGWTGFCIYEADFTRCAEHPDRRASPDHVIVACSRSSASSRPAPVPDHPGMSTTSTPAPECVSMFLSPGPVDHPRNLTLGLAARRRGGGNRAVGVVGCRRVVWQGRDSSSPVVGSEVPRTHAAGCPRTSVMGMTSETGSSRSWGTSPLRPGPEYKRRTLPWSQVRVRSASRRRPRGGPVSTETACASNSQQDNRGLFRASLGY